jgi:hypothetical protein
MSDENGAAQKPRLAVEKAEAKPRITNKEPVTFVKNRT